MAGKNISFTVEAKDKATGTLNKVSKNINKMSSEMKNAPINKFQKSWVNLTKSMGAYSAAIAVGVKALKSYCSAIVQTAEAANKQIAAETKLKTAAANNPYLNGKSVNALKNYASELQKVTTYGDEELLPLMGQLASAGRSQEQIMSIMKVATDMAASGMYTLDSAVTQLNATYSGNIGKMGQQMAGLKDLTKEQLASGEAVELLGKRFEGMAESVATATGSLTQMNNAKGDFMEAIGMFTKPTADNWNNFWKTWYESGTEFLTKFMDDWDNRIAQRNAKTQISQMETNLKSNPALYKDAGERFIEITQEMRALSLAEKEAIQSYLSSKASLTDIESQILQAANLQVTGAYTSRSDAEELKRKAEEQRRVEEENNKKLETANGWLQKWYQLASSNPLDYKNKHDYSVAQGRKNKQYLEAVAAMNMDSNAMKIVKYYEALWASEYDSAVQEFTARQAASHSGSYTNSYSVMGGEGFKDYYIAPVMESFAEMGPLLANSIQSISSINALLNWQSVIIDGFMEVVEPLVNEILAPMVGALKIVGVILGETIKPILEAIGIVLKPIYEALTWLLNGLASVCNFISNVFIDIVNAIIRLVNKLPFVNISELAKNQVKTDYTSADLTATGTSALSNYSSGSATYSGARDVYITINYDHSYVNGDARDIALNLYNEFRMAEALGYAG